MYACLFPGRGRRSKGVLAFFIIGGTLGALLPTPPMYNPIFLFYTICILEIKFSEELEDGINKQISHELSAHYTYLSMVRKRIKARFVHQNNVFTML